VTDTSLAPETPDAPDTTNSVHPAIIEALEKLARRAHLTADLAAISEKFHELGQWIVAHTYHGAGTKAALDKLWEAKNLTVDQHVRTKEKNETQAAEANA